tara:strand:+ start:238 stop:1512 length:1275 start_codon:yes stop_codon:yes gene_type:complete
MSDVINPYQLLGVTTNSTLSDIKKAYYSLSLLCHPDKGGKKEDMLVVHNAYLYITKQIKQQVTDTENTYKNAENEFESFCKEQKEKPPTFYQIQLDNDEVLKKFNDQFDELQKTKSNYNFNNPFINDGYGHLMESSVISSDTYNNEEELFNEPLQNKFKQEVIIYNSPEYLPNTYGSYQQLDVDKVTDFSHQSDHLSMTDYKNAHSQPLDTQKILELTPKDTFERSLEKIMEERDIQEKVFVQNNSQTLANTLGFKSIKFNSCFTDKLHVKFNTTFTEYYAMLQKNTLYILLKNTDKTENKDNTDIEEDYDKYFNNISNYTNNIYLYSFIVSWKNNPDKISILDYHIINLKNTQFYDQKDNSNTNLTTNTDNTIKLIQKNSQIEIYFQPNDFNKYITWKQRILSVIPTNNILLKKCHKKNIITI